MNTSLKLFIELFLLSIAYWVSAFVFYVFIRYYGLEAQMDYFVDEKLNFPIYETFRVALFIGGVTGCIYTLVEWIFDTFLSAKLILGFSIIIKSIVYFVLMVFLLSVSRSFIEAQIDLQLTTKSGLWYANKMFWSTIIYFSVASVVFSLLRIANNKFGPGVFFNMLLGKYKKPKEETRILMFLDLKDSTTIAEKLGHIVYSNFIQECFKDLNKVITKYDAEIYQYVGDEAVISWTTKKGFHKKNCIKLFFAFTKRLNKRQKYYLEHYNFQPQFKAGLHCGKLMVAEVGIVKKEIAYHGDVINTAARIQAKCNAYNSSFLISEAINQNLYLAKAYTLQTMGSIILKGKLKAVNIIAITEN